MDDLTRALDQNGYPIFLAAHPGTPSGGRVVPTKSGNPRHGTGGKFGVGPQQTQTAPGAAVAPTAPVVPGVPAPGADASGAPHPDDWAKRDDHVRSVAREFDAQDVGDIRDFLQGRTTRELSNEEINSFHRDVKAQRLSDLVDILDAQMRGTIDRVKRGRRTVKVQAPKGWIKRTINGLEQPEIQQLIRRLEGLGHSTEDLKKDMIRRVSSPANLKAVESILGEKDLSAPAPTPPAA